MTDKIPEAMSREYQQGYVAGLREGSHIAFNYASDLGIGSKNSSDIDKALGANTIAQLLHKEASKIEQPSEQPSEQKPAVRIESNETK